MSKLLQFKEWLSLEDAARHLSMAFTEPVEVSDLLRLALDGHLTLSLHLVNYTYGKPGRALSEEEAGTHRVPHMITLVEDLAEPDSEGKRFRKPDAPFRGWTEIEWPAGRELPDGRFLVLEEFVKRMDGLWDVVMVSGARIDVENLFQRLVDGPEVRLISMNGTLLARPNDADEIWELQERHDYRPTNPEWKRLAEAGESTEGVPILAPEKIKGYIQAAGLPEGSELVLRTAVLTRFLGTAMASGGHQSVGITWPDHDTPKLAALRDAALNFWSTYEEGQDPPSSKAVAAWLVGHRGIKPQLAETMASILRPPTLPPGPLPKNVN